MGLKKWYAKLDIDVQKDLNRLCAVCDKSCKDINRGCLFKWNIYQFSKSKRACKFVQDYKDRLENKEEDYGNH